jgi:hypothetical protein
VTLSWQMDALFQEAPYCHYTLLARIGLWLKILSMEKEGFMPQSVLKFQENWRTVVFWREAMNVFFRLRIKGNRPSRSLGNRL